MLTYTGSGPDVAQNQTSNLVHSHTDMAPTILQMLGLPQREEFDGAPIAYTAETLGNTTKNELVNVEFWTAPGSTSKTYYNNTYKALRLMSDEYSFLYTTWCTGEHEFYDMVTDPHQMQNRLADPPRGAAAKYYGRSESNLFDRLNALLMVTKGCAKDTCRDPWSELFPQGNVNNLTEAMRQEYDGFFSNQPKISFTGCPTEHILAEEGPQLVNVFHTST